MPRSASRTASRPMSRLDSRLVSRDASRVGADCALEERPLLFAPRASPPLRPIADMWSRLRLTASPPLRPASRASFESNSCAVPFSCAARPPLLAISRCLLGSIEANPRLLFPSRSAITLLQGVGVQLSHLRPCCSPQRVPSDHDDSGV